MCLLGTSALAEVIIIEGFYQGKDLYVKNPNSPKGVGFCVYEVQINDDVTADEINSNAFVIDLHSLGLEIGAPLVVKILHHDECKPKVLNMEAVLPQSTYELSALEMDAKGVLHWTTSNEIGELPYIIQQFKWNKWVNIGEVIGTGRMDENTYSFQVSTHTGHNVYRIAQRANKGKTRYTEEVTFESSQSTPVTLASDKFSKAVAFSAKTHYEIFDEYGRLVKRGFDKLVDIAALSKGQYYINYDNRFGESFSKR
jgi:hypothetical protein